MGSNEKPDLYDWRQEVFISPNPNLNARNSVKHEVIIAGNMKYLRSELCAFLDESKTSNVLSLV